MHPALILWGERLLAGGIYGGLGAIGLSLVLGFGVLALQLNAYLRSGAWSKYTLIDIARTAGWQLPVSISGFEDVNYLWGVFLREGSLALTFLLYVPLVILLTGFGIWQVVAFARRGGQAD